MLQDIYIKIVFLNYGHETIGSDKPMKEKTVLEMLSNREYMEWHFYTIFNLLITKVTNIASDMTDTFTEDTTANDQEEVMMFMEMTELANSTKFINARNQN